MTTAQTKLNRALVMFSLVLAGEAIFGLPFHVSRYFRPLYVEVFGISQTQLGVLGSIYGVVAMFAYLAGGGLADRFSPRGLLSFSLLITGASGLYMMTVPSFNGMCWLFAFWGVSTILPFWSALIRATRDWGGTDQQGMAFGLLDGGRGALAAVLAMVALYLFARLLPDGGSTASAAQKAAALKSTILVYTIACGVAAAFVWMCLPSATTSRAVSAIPQRSGHLLAVLKMPAVWLQAVVIIAAYCAFKGTDYYSQYAKDVWHWSDVQAAGISAFSTWMRPVAAIGAGLLADRMSSSRVVIGCFVLTAIAYVSFVCTTPSDSTSWLLWVNVLVCCLGLFALRGIYFALLEESKVPTYMTGTAVGVVSFIGYTPEIFMPLLGGWLLDRWPESATGYHVLFSFLGAMSVLGIVATLALRHIHRRDADGAGAPA